MPSALANCGLPVEWILVFRGRIHVSEIEIVTDQVAVGIHFADSMVGTGGSCSIKDIVVDLGVSGVLAPPVIQGDGLVLVAVLGDDSVVVNLGTFGSAGDVNPCTVILIAPTHVHSHVVPGDRVFLKGISPFRIDEHLNQPPLDVVAVVVLHHRADAVIVEMADVAIGVRIAQMLEYVELDQGAIGAKRPDGAAVDGGVHRIELHQLHPSFHATAANYGSS